MKFVAQGIVEVAGAEVRITPTEQKLLSALIEAEGAVLSRQDMLMVVFGWTEHMATGAGAKATRSVDMAISRLRKKIPGIDTVRGFGHRFIGV